LGKSIRNDQIEFLRAIAILFTVVLHLKVVTAFNTATFLDPLYKSADFSVGVDLFLVISGYVITHSLINSYKSAGSNRTKSIISFWVRRAFRLLPTAWLWLTVVALVGLASNAISGKVGLFEYEVASIGAAMLNIMNIYEPYCLNNPELTWCPNEMFDGSFLHGHYWSLSLEEQFYIIFPLIFFFVKRPFIIALLTLAIAAQFFWLRPFFTLFWYIKTDALCWGVLLAFMSCSNWYQRLRSFFCLHHHIAQTIFVVGLVLFPIIAVNIQGVFRMRAYGVGVVALIGAIIVLFASFEVREVNRKYWCNRAMLYLGSRSYGIYIIHLIIFYVISRVDSLFSIPLANTNQSMAVNALLGFVALSLTMLLAELNYRIIENPWRIRGRKISTRLLSH
jgi:peptidoglycan/LPS O-acetylase OafA/YrhL